MYLIKLLLNHTKYQISQCIILEKLKIFSENLRFHDQTLSKVPSFLSL
jgi:hypothetical protein